MLKSLFIKDYAIIDELVVDFSNGLNVFTGETGAGKSIIVGALSLLLKGRGDTSVISKGKDKTIIEGVFDIEEKYEDIKKTLDEQDIPFDGELIVRRTISNDNHSSIKLNQCSVTLSFLTDLFSNYIDIHSQKDSQYLYHKKNQLSVLDKFSDIDKKLIEYKSLYENYNKLNNELDTLVNHDFNEREIEYLKFDFEELNDAGLSVEEEIDLQSKEKRYKQAEQYINLLNNINSLYNGDESIKEKIDTLINVINIDDESIMKYKEKLNDLYYSFDDCVNEIKSELEKVADDDLDLNYIEERLYAYSKLKRKHKLETEELIKLKDDLKTKLDLLSNRDKVIADKKKEVDEAKKKALDKAKEISKIRKQAALKLEKEVIKEANDLLLPNTNFKISFNDIEMNGSGTDDIEFLISLNKGEDLKPLKSVASGGETSRLMLALKTVFAKISDTGLLIFDEIDSGVSGKVALAVGEKMSLISKDAQVFCITHLAPVAAFADSHYLIYKVDDSKSSKTNVKLLNKDEVVNELASISSSDVNSSSVAAAKELLKTVKTIKNK